MVMQAPPTRYKIIEQGRRLVTIDTHTGDEINPLAARVGEQARAMQEPVKEAAPGPWEQAPSRAGSTTAEGSNPLADAALPLRLILVCAVLAVGGWFLYVTHLWVFLVLALTAKPARRMLFGLVVRAFSTLFNDR